MDKLLYIVQTALPLCQTAIWNSTFTMVVGSTGTTGTTATLLSSPYDVAFDGFGFMYVADFNNHRIQRYRQGFLSIIFKIKLNENIFCLKDQM